MSDEGFLGRWSRRKLDVKHGKAAEEPAAEQQPAPRIPQAPPEAGEGARPAAGVTALNAQATPQSAPEPQVQPPPPTLEDVKSLTANSDFTRFAAADVAPEVKNAALKKLFADPRYNVMDGMDVYTGDYSKPDPISTAMLRQMAGAKFLGLFREEETKVEVARQARDVANNPTPQKVAQSGSESQAVPEPPHADPDLQLQQDHAAPGEDPGDGAR
jgi:hypothetical protein